MLEMKPAPPLKAAMKPALEPQKAPMPGAPAAKAPFRLPVRFSKKHPARNAQAEHRLAQRLRVDESVSLAEKYPQLKSLKVSLEFVDREGITKTTEIKYTANPEHAKAVLVFGCPIRECVGGDFDVTARLAEAVAARRTKLAERIFCMGTHNRASGQAAPCRSELHYTLNLSYSKRR